MPFRIGKGSTAFGMAEAFTSWLMKSEPESRLENGVDVKFGIEDLKMEPEQTACWDGVRNYQVAFNLVKERIVKITWLAILVKKFQAWKFIIFMRK